MYQTSGLTGSAALDQYQPPPPQPHHVQCVFDAGIIFAEAFAAAFGTAFAFTGALAFGTVFDSVMPTGVGPGTAFTRAKPSSTRTISTLPSLPWRKDAAFQLFGTSTLSVSGWT